MTFQKKHKENKKLILLYLAYLTELGTLSDRLKLISEIARLDKYNKEIEALTVEKYNLDCDDFTIKINSLIDGKNKN